MARGSFEYQTASSLATSRPGTVTLRGTTTATTRMQRRRPGAAGGVSGAFSRGGGGDAKNMLCFCIDDAPGLKITPAVILAMSLRFIAFVTALHVFGKLYRYRSGAGS